MSSLAFGVHVAVGRRRKKTMIQLLVGKIELLLLIHQNSFELAILKLGNAFREAFNLAKNLQCIDEQNREFFVRALGELFDELQHADEEILVLLVVERWNY